MALRSRFWVTLDCSMLLAVVVLLAWRLTGVVMHEWLGVALIVGLLAHLLLHWQWVETRSRRILAPRSGRARVNFALNFALFAAMTVAMVSGFMISKAVLPAHLVPAEYVKWHDVHDVSARVTLVGVGLHLGLNWDLMVIAVGNFLTRRAARERSFLKGLRLRPLLVQLGIITAAVAIVGAGIWGVERVLPKGDVTLIQPNGKRIEHAEPPVDIARLHRGEAAPSARGVPAFVVQGVFVAAATVIGRKVLRLRLD
jgi:hypothetical protein